MMKKFGNFGVICMVAILLVLVVSLCVDAKHKRNRNRYRAQVERVEDRDNHGNHDNYSNNRRNRNQDRNNHGNRGNRDNRGSYEQDRNASAVSSPLTEVNISSKFTNEKKQYTAMTVNFNTAYRVPNCVSYVLTSDMIDITNGPGAEHRRNYKFYADPSVNGCPEWYEYRGSGYDRGHMAPANDMRWSRQSMSDCFLMTNICPQDHDLNGGSWNKLELKVHDWAKQYGKIIVATGPIFNGANNKIGNNNDIVVPSGFFKVVFDPGRNRAIGFIYDNHEGGGGVVRHACSVDEVERVTGHDFFSSLPDDVERQVESMFNFDQW